MFKSLIEWVEKLITEHGSSAIMTERLALADERHAALEKQLSEWKTAAEAANAVVRIFQKENGRLRVEIQRQQDEVRTLTDILYSKPVTVDGRFKPDEF